MRSLFIVGADSPLGRNVCEAISSEFDIVTDSCTFGSSDVLQRGQLIDQMRRFGPFDVVLLCLDINSQREVDYAVDIVPDVLAKPWLAFSVLQELYPQMSGLDLLIATPVFDQDSQWGLSMSEGSNAVTIIHTAIERFRALASHSADLYLHECEGADSTVRRVQSLLAQA